MNLKKLFSFQNSDLTIESKDVEPIGDGGAVYISDATDEEYDEYQKNEVQGWGKFKAIIDILKK